jgi:hypothetical protein
VPIGGRDPAPAAERLGQPDHVDRTAHRRPEARLQPAAERLLDEHERGGAAAVARLRPGPIVQRDSGSAPLRYGLPRSPRRRELRRRELRIRAERRNALPIPTGCSPSPSDPDLVIPGGGTIGWPHCPVAMSRSEPVLSLRGRGRECATLELLLTGIGAGHSRVLVLRGEAGIGKSAPRSACTTTAHRTAS